jgi:arginine:ornithine antiporter/lysine permease
MSDNNEKKLGLFALIGLVVGSSIGGGIFNATANVARTAAAGPALLAWILVSLGMLFLVLSLNNIVAKKPELGGIVEYAEAGFGKFWGMISGWGYWLSAWLGNIAFAALLLSAAGNFIPALQLGNNPGALGIDPANILPTVVISIVMWLLMYLVNRGIESAAFINAVVLVAKLIPLIVVLIASVVTFNAGIFTSNFWTNIAANAEGAVEAIPPFDQVKSCFMVMLWVFVGVEGASIFGKRARRKSDAAKATAGGFITLVVAYILISMVPYGVMTQAELAELGEPALAFVLERIVGPWGAPLVNLGLIISLLGAWISWTLLPTETLQQMADLKYLPKKFGEVNKNGAPTFSLLLTTICAQVFMVTFIFPAFTIKGMSPYDFGFTLCSSTILITWFLGALYQVKLSLTNGDKTGIAVNTAIGVLASAFLLWMIIEAGLVYILVSFVTYIPAFFLYHRARKADGEEKPAAGLISVWMGLITLGAVVSVILLITNVISL